MKNKQYHTPGTIPKENIKIIERGQIDSTNTQMHDLLFSWHGTGTSLKGGGFELVNILHINNPHL